MHRLAVLFFVAASSARFLKPEHDYLLFEKSNSIIDVHNITKVHNQREPVEKAWVLDLSGDVVMVKLRVAPESEVREVFSGPRFSKRPSQEKRVKKGEPKAEASSAAPDQDVDEKAMLAEIMRATNKFVLSIHTEPDAYLADFTDGPSLKLYFKDIHTALVVRAGNKQWHYVIGPALFPEWFYEGHTAVGRDSRGQFVELPKHVKMEFYSALFHMLTLFSSFPV